MSIFESWGKGGRPKSHKLILPSVVILGHLFDGPDSPTKFRWKRSKIKGSYTYELAQAQKGQKQGWALKNDS